MQQSLELQNHFFAGDKVYTEVIAFGEWRLLTEINLFVEHRVTGEIFLWQAFSVPPNVGSRFGFVPDDFVHEPLDFSLFKNSV